jgi:DNA polymerase
MDLELDDRQRAMLQEMGVRVWLPAGAVAAEALPVPPTPVAPAVSAPRPAVAPPEPTHVPARFAAAAGGSVAPAAGVPGEALALHQLDWAALAQTAAACQACGLCAGRKNSTLQLPDAPAQADWLVVGDPPDEDEDRLAQPFVEQAGLLLDAMLKAVGARRSAAGRQGAYLTNVVKCRPPPGRLPQMAELAQCAQYLQREVALVQPKVILAMGRFATQVLLGEHPEQAALPLGKQRGTVYRYRGIPVVVTYHPKVLLRASADKAKAWADLCLAMDVLDGAV